jgi:hypothetical protein
MKSLTALIVLAACLGTSSCFFPAEREHPKDSELIKNFQTHRAEFDELLEMFKADRSLGRVGPDFTRPANFFERCEGPNARNGNEIEVSEERLADYRKRFSRLGLPYGIEGYCDKHRVHFYASGLGLSVTGSTKGYAYSDDPPQTLVDDLDTYWSTDGHSFWAYRRIEGNWYLYFQYED